MKNGQEISKGNAFDYMLTEDKQKGEVLVVQSGIGIYTNTGVEGDTIAVRRTGVWALPAKNEDAINQGDEVFWDDTNKEITITDTGTKAGEAWSSKQASTDELVGVKIG